MSCNQAIIAFVDAWPVLTRIRAGVVGNFWRTTAVGSPVQTAVFRGTVKSPRAMVRPGEGRVAAIEWRSILSESPSQRDERPRKFPRFFLPTAKSNLRSVCCTGHYRKRSYELREFIKEIKKCLINVYPKIDLFNILFNFAFTKFSNFILPVSR